MQQRIVVEGPILQLPLLLGSCVLVKKQKEPRPFSYGLVPALPSAINRLCQPLFWGSTNYQLLIGTAGKPLPFVS